MRMIFLCLCLLLPFCSGAHHYTVSACAIFKDEAPYLEEWLAYHRMVGVQHFWLYNNGSSDDYKKVLAPWINNGIVELIEWPNSKEEGFWGYTTQPAAYRDAIVKARDRSKWLAIIDLDEYIVPMKEKNIEKTLHKYYEDASAVYVTWLQFGTGGVNIGPGPILKKLTRCAQIDNVWNTIGKSIVRPKRVGTCIDPHFCMLKNGCYFDGDGNIGENVGFHHNKLLRINHYTFRDEWYFQNIKIPRCVQWGTSVEELEQKNADFSASQDFKMIHVISNFEQHH